MRPIPQTVQLASELGRGDASFDLLSHLQDVADRIQDVVADCIGLSITWVDEGVTFTLVASDTEIAVLDAVQYLSGGPCVEGVDRGTGLHWSNTDPLDERRWQRFAQATAARAVRSTLTFPLVAQGLVVGSANLYAAADRSFEGHAERLASIVGASADDVVRNADLSFATRAIAESAPDALCASDVHQQAVGVLAGWLGVDEIEAAERLDDAASRAGMASHALAAALVLLLT